MQNSSPPDPDLSVIIPARNEEQYIAAALASVAAQHWPPAGLEVVVVDNGSTDGTASVVQAFQAAHPRLAVQLVEEPVPGVARAKNRGAQAAHGTWLIFLDADSRLAPNLAPAVMQWGQRGYSAGSIRIVADSRDWVDRGFFALMELGKRLFAIQAQMFYCSRAIFLDHGGFGEELALAEDREFLVRLQRAGVTLCQVQDSWIATSPRRLRRLPFRINMVLMFARWALANLGIGRRWPY